MQNKKLIIILASLVALASGGRANAGTPLTDTNLQVFYDLGSDRKYVTTTFEMFHQDSWGSTFFFSDIDYNFTTGETGKNIGPGGTYMEISRCLNFWQDSALGNLSLQVEYNGGLGAMFGGYTVNHAFLAGLNYLIHSDDFKNTLNLSVLYKKFVGLSQNVPMQLTAVWGLQDLFGISGLRFSGFADVWCEGSSAVFISEPQLWYAAGRLFGCDNLNIGSEVEISNNFAGAQGWKCRPCLGIKWIF